MSLERNNLALIESQLDSMSQNQKKKDLGGKVEAAPKKKTQGFVVEQGSSQSDSLLSKTPPSTFKAPSPNSKNMESDSFQDGKSNQPSTSAQQQQQQPSVDKNGLTKAQRREIQERQRAEKQQKQQPSQKPKAEKQPVQQPAQQQSQQQSQPQQIKSEKQPQQSSSLPQQSPASSSQSFMQQSQTQKSLQSTPPSSGQSKDNSQSSKDPNAAKKPNTGKSTIAPTPTPNNMQFDDAKKRYKAEKNQLLMRKESEKKVAFFSHLQQYEVDGPMLSSINFESLNVHPAIVEVGLRYLPNHINPISGANARCVAMLEALKCVIRDYKTPPNQELSRSLDLKPQINFLTSVRPIAVGMGNAIRYLKDQISKSDNSLPETEAKELLISKIDTYIKERITVAGEVISSSTVSKIRNGDVVLTYSCSSIVQQTLLDAHNEGLNFRVIIVDSRPKLEGKILLGRLLKAGITCCYVQLNALSYVVQEATKVLLGAHSMFSNGTLMSRTGTSMVAMMAHLRKIPVIVLCETYKFSDRVQLDSFVFNELGQPDDLLPTKNGEAEATLSLSNWRSLPNLRLLNLYYDITPSEFISMVVTEVGMIPCTSIPVVHREYQM